MVDFFLKSGDEQKAENATFLDDIDLIPSRERNGPSGPMLVAVAQKNGHHVCWQCGEAFNPMISKLLGVEVQQGHAYILLHQGCVDGRPKSFRSFLDVTRGLSARRFITKATKTLDSALKKVVGE